jgi:hypothetical protein
MFLGYFVVAVAYYYLCDIKIFPLSKNVEV